jgi:hypothetical protein
VVVAVGKKVNVVGTAALGVPVGWTVTVAVDVVVRFVVVVASSEDSVGVGRKTGFVRLADCVVSGAVVSEGAAWLEVLAAAVDELEADEAVEDVVGSMGADDVTNTASLVVDAEVVVAAAAELDVDATLSVDVELAGRPTEVVVDNEVRSVVPV